MAGDWIKMRSNLWDDPRVARMCDLTNERESAIVGGLYWLWATADQHSEDGIMLGLTLRAIDRKTGIPGFGEALVSAGWLADHPEGVRIVRFSEHNGKSAKRRCSESVRKMSARNADKLENDCRTIEDESQQSCAPREREEKEKENKEQDQKQKQRAPRFDAQAHLVSMGVDDSIAADWIQSRRVLKATPTLTAIDGIAKEAARAGTSLADALAICCQRGWRGFKAEWLKNGDQEHGTRKTQHQINHEATTRAIFGSMLNRPDSLKTIEGEVVR